MKRCTCTDFGATSAKLLIIDVDSLLVLTIVYRYKLAVLLILRGILCKISGGGSALTTVREKVFRHTNLACKFKESLP
ncbi:MAG TPA: hypothetical protein VK699_16705 [Terriglobales bacterium]|jgi:hypothetical protein|nr:hypothetical protein [Terriglobales bacterium]